MQDAVILRHSTSFWKLLQMLLQHALQLLNVSALAFVLKLFNSQDSPVTGNQDLTVVLACPREVRPVHEQVFVQFKTLTAEITVGLWSKLNVRMLGNGLWFFSVKGQGSLLHSLDFA